MSRILGVSASLGKDSRTARTVEEVLKQANAAGASVEMFDLREHPFPVMDPDAKKDFAAYKKAKKDLEWADAVVLGTPDYHGSMSGAMKNFMDHFWAEFAGKVFGFVVVSYEKGLTAVDQMRTAVRQCYGWSMPYGVSAHPTSDFSVTGEVASDHLKQRTTMLGWDLERYSGTIHTLFKDDLRDATPGFADHYRKKKEQGQKFKK